MSNKQHTPRSLSSVRADLRKINQRREFETRALSLQRIENRTTGERKTEEMIDAAYLFSEFMAEEI